MTPYDRERKLSPILVAATRRGVRVDRDLLLNHQQTYSEALAMVEARVRATLESPDLNLSSPAQLGKALDNAGAVTHQVFTPKGRRSVKREVLESTIADKGLRDDVIYYGAIRKCLSDFIVKWLELSHTDGRVHPNWNQVRSRDDFGGGKGARTGRLSCDHPNLQNPPNQYKIEVPSDCPEPPTLRRAFLPEEGHVWLKRDFSGQEIRVAAHFEDGILLEAYQKNPSLDPHSMAQEMIKAVAGLEFQRPQVKITAFQIIYGGGPRAVSSQVGCTYEEAIQLINAYLRAFPGIKWLQTDTKQMGRQGMPITTWGGRRYYTEPAKYVDKYDRIMSFEYKLLNYLIQGSAADQTKQCICDWEDMRGADDVFLATVHDEINISAPADIWEESMDRLRLAMDQDLFDVPMRSEGFVGENWADIKETD
jgi:DNA polymerase-1